MSGLEGRNVWYVDSKHEFRASPSKYEAGSTRIETADIEPPKYMAKTLLDKSLSGKDLPDVGEGYFSGV